MSGPTPEARRVAAELVRPLFIEAGEFTDGDWCVEICGHAFFDPEPRQEDAEFIAEAIRDRLATALTRAAQEAREAERERCASLVERIAPTEYVQRIAAALRQAGKE